MTVNSVKVVILGDSAVGKTSLIQTYISSKNKSLSTTLGAIYIQMEHSYVEDNNKVIFPIQVWDTAGQERYNSLIPMYLRNSDIIVLAFDLSNKKTFYNLDKWLKLTKNTGVENFVLVGCKNDLSRTHGVTDLEIYSYIDEKIPNTKFFITSSKQNFNIQDLFNYIKKILEKKVKSKKNLVNKIIYLEKSKEKNYCCF